MNEPLQGERALFRGPEYVFFEIPANEAYNPPSWQLRQFGQHEQNQLPCCLAGGSYAYFIRIS